MTAVNPSGLCDSFSFTAVKSPCTSYLYNSSGNNYLFPDPRMTDFSIIPAIDLEGKKVVFTVHGQHSKLALYYDESFIFSLPELMEKIRLPENLNQELLDKIALIANYLAQGEEYKYVSGTARQESTELKFLVRNTIHRRCQVTFLLLKTVMHLYIRR